jgi:hypothetical protein
MSKDTVEEWQNKVDSADATPSNTKAPPKPPASIGGSSGSSSVSESKKEVREAKEKLKQAYKDDEYDLLFDIESLCKSKLVHPKLHTVSQNDCS